MGVPLSARLPVLLLGLAAAPAATAAQGLHLIPNVLEISVDTLPDVAIAAVDDAEPIIYYNPRLMNRYGPRLGVFFLAHEYGHLQYHHTRAGLAGMSDGVRDSLLQAQELEADCYAAAQLGGRDREAVEAAIRFFTRLGPFRFDAVHPTGAQRATRILSCMPDQGANGWLRPTGETGLETGPVSGYAEPVRFTVSTAPLGDDDIGREAKVWIDGKLVGQVSNLRSPTALEVTSVPAGFHSYRLTMDVYGLDGFMQLMPQGTVSGSGYLSLTEGDRFLVQWAMGSPPTLVKAKEVEP
jgi:hypothetical protein